PRGYRGDPGHAAAGRHLLRSRTPPEGQTIMTSLPTIDPNTLKRRLDEGSAVLIDIREPAEHARERIAGARLVPLSVIERHELARDKAVVFHCRTGNGTAANASVLRAKNCPEAYALAGGLDAWKAAGLPIETDRHAPIELFRQVQIAAGSLVLLGLLLAVLVTP